MPPLEERERVLAAHARGRLLVGQPPRRSPDDELGLLTHGLGDGAFAAAAAAAVAVGDVEQRRFGLKEDVLRERLHRRGVLRGVLGQAHVQVQRVRRGRGGGGGALRLGGAEGRRELVA